MPETFPRVSSSRSSKTPVLLSKTSAETERLVIAAHGSTGHFALLSRSENHVCFCIGVGCQLRRADLVRNWNARVIRGFAILNVGLCLFGLWALIYGFHETTKLNFPNQPYLPQVFYLFETIEFMCLIFGLVSAVPLWRLKRSGLLLCNLLFGFELLYVLGQAFLALAFIGSSNQVLRGLGSSIAGATGIGGLGLALQDITAYPIIALIALNVAYHKLRKIETSAVSVAQP